MNNVVRTTVAAVALLTVGGGGLVVTAGVPALDASARLQELQKAQAADDAKQATGRDVVLARSQQISTSKDGKKAQTGAQRGRDQKSEHLQNGRGLSEALETDHIANWIAIENLRAATAVYFLSFILGLATIIGLLVSMLSLLDSRRALRAASGATRSRVAIRVIASSGADADFDVFPATDHPFGSGLSAISMASAFAAPAERVWSICLPERSRGPEAM